eukprot:Sspe_Gene.55744::Locus_30657_Transcript_1_1_Confidence_1.000_Length_3717::g.55744::m.55744
MPPWLLRTLLTVVFTVVAHANPSWLLRNEGRGLKTLIHGRPPGHFVVTNGTRCLFRCSADHEGCPCPASAQSPCSTKEASPSDTSCFPLIVKHCCSELGRRDRHCLTAGVLWDYVCPGPPRSAGYQGKAGAAAKAYTSSGVTATSSDPQMPPSRATGEPSWEPPGCGTYGPLEMSLEGWMPNLDLNTSHGATPLPSREAVLLSIPPTVNITKVTVHERGATGYIDKVFLLEYAATTITEDPERFTDAFEIYTNELTTTEKHLSPTDTNYPPDLDYHGTVNVSTDGLPCLSWGHMLYDHPFLPYEWGTSSPWDEDLRAYYLIDRTQNLPPTSSKGDGVGNHNFCRNPDKDPKGAWCYVWDASALGPPPTRPGTQWAHIPPPLKKIKEEQTQQGGGERGPPIPPDPGMQTPFPPAPSTGQGPGPMPGGEGTWVDPMQGGGDPMAGGGTFGGSGMGGDPMAGGGSWAGSGMGGDPLIGGSGMGGSGNGWPLGRRFETLSADPHECDTPSFQQCLQYIDEQQRCVKPLDDMCSEVQRCNNSLVQRCGFNPYTKGCWDRYEPFQKMLMRHGDTNFLGKSCAEAFDPSATVRLRKERCGVYGVVCCRTCFPDHRYNIFDFHPPAMEGSVLKWPLFKRYCTLPQPTTCVAPEVVVGTSGPVNRLITGVLVVLKPTHNTYTAIDTVSVVGQPAQGCNANWQAPACRSCLANSTTVFKGPSCNSTSCPNRADCKYGYCNSTGDCQCFEGFAGPSCSIQCPLNATAARTPIRFLGNEALLPAPTKALTTDSNGIVTRPDLLGRLNGWLICSGHGECNDGVSGDGTCVCQRGYAGADCSLQCPGLSPSDFGDNTVCSGHGNCHDGTDGNATCTCEGLYSGDDCSRVTCNGKDCVNGVCLDVATEDYCKTGSTGCYCACFGKESYSGVAPFESQNAGLRGYWDGETCSTCLTGYTGTNCNIPLRSTKTIKGSAEGGVPGVHGPLAFALCSDVDVTLTLTEGDKATLAMPYLGERVQGGSWCPGRTVTKDSPKTTCSKTVQYYERQHTGSLTIAVRADQKVKYTLEIKYQPKCTVDCGHGLCTNPEVVNKQQQQQQQMMDQMMMMMPGIFPSRHAHVLGAQEDTRTPPRAYVVEMNERIEHAKNILQQVREELQGYSQQEEPAQDGHPNRKLLQMSCGPPPFGPFCGAGFYCNVVTCAPLKLCGAISLSATECETNEVSGGFCSCPGASRCE